MERRWWPLGLTSIAFACATGQGVDFDSLCADEHMQIAEEENEKADEAFARIEPDASHPSVGVEDRLYWGYARDPFLFDDLDYYTSDPRVFDPNEDDEESARKHRDKAERHEAAADALAGGCPPARAPST
jgi:hypothetical protein